MQKNSSKPKKEKDQATAAAPPAGKAKMTLHLGQRPKSPQAKPPAKPAPQPPQSTKPASKRGSKTKPGMTHVSITPDDERSSSNGSRSSSGSYSSGTRSTANSGAPRAERTSHKEMDEDDF